ncbi:type II toxin-antitoxin system VapC family toxin [Enterovirga sp. GCM10030262]|uniref:type II toxin-antitoxin system VapC family toxin n=1 Tax=Enterovirga sp. GCM10030262 TaxID=3273391 RepID=UPI00360A48C1
MTGYLLDTHGLIWWWTEAGQLSAAARHVIESGDQTIVVSTASIWEIAIKTASGKLNEIEDFQRDYRPLMTRNGFESLAMRDDHALMAAFLPGRHRDPFDRMLAAQAVIEDLIIITRDPQLANFGCRTLW